MFAAVKFSRVTQHGASLLAPLSRSFCSTKQQQQSQSSPIQNLDNFETSMKKTNQSWNLGIKDDEYSKYEALSNPVFSAFDRVNELYNEYFDSIFPESNVNNTGKRDYIKPGYNNERNPYNAWQLQGKIEPPKEILSNIENTLLKGKKIVLKDTISVAQWPMQNGSKMFKNYIPNMDATIVNRILENGGIIVGKSTNEDLCYSGGSHTSWPYGVKNPYNIECHAGGSSSGTAVLVATQGKTNNDKDSSKYDYQVDIGISGDQGGSIRIPACWCGAFGYKPSWGLVPYTGVAEIAAHFDHVGPCATNMKDIGDLLTSIAGKDGIDIRQLHAPNYLSKETQSYLQACNSNNIENYSKEKDGITIGILTEGFNVPNMDDNIFKCIHDNLYKLKSNSNKINHLIKDIKQVSIPIHNDMTAIWCAIGYESQFTAMYQYATNGINPKNRSDPLMNEIWKLNMMSNENDDNDGIAIARHVLSHTNKQNILIGNYLLNRTNYSSFGELFSKGTLLADKATKIYENVMNDNNIDVLVCPTLPILNDKMPDTRDDAIEMVTNALNMISNTAPFNVTGSPALTIPFEIDGLKGKNGGKLFAGMQLIGRVWDDKTVLKAGTIIENALLK